MTNYRIFRNNIVEKLPDGRHVDPVLMSMARHHGETDEQIDEIVEFCSLRPIHVRQLDILLRNIGRRIPFLGSAIGVTTWEGDRLAICTMNMGNGLVWGSNQLKCSDSVIPETLRVTMRGRALGEVVEHPYLPKDLVLATVTQAKDHWVANFDAKRRPRKAA